MDRGKKERKKEGQIERQTDGWRKERSEYSYALLQFDQI